MKPNSTQLNGIRVCAGGTSQAEQKWLYAAIKKFAVRIPFRAKLQFQYQLPLIGKCCRESWVQVVGMPNAQNSRVRRIEAKIRKGQLYNTRCVGRPRSTVLTGTQYASAFLTDHILNNSQHSPATTEL